MRHEAAVSANSGVLTLTNVTAVAGGSLYNWFGKAHLYNTIIANNGQPDCSWL